MKAKSNQRCLYCFSDVGKGSDIESNKEHLIGRDFVPTGSFSDTDFNFIFRACKRCNSQKSEWERHVSSVSLFNSLSTIEDPDILDIAKNKASKDFHPDKKGKRVIDSHSKFSINLGDILKFRMVQPPQLNRQYVEMLALRHVQGMFSMLTSKNPLDAAETRLLSPVNVWHFNYFNKKDWGNTQLLEIIERTESWLCYCNTVTANGFFRILMKQSPVPKEGWFWAFEWNKYIRVVGALAVGNNKPAILSDLTPLDSKELSNAGEVVLRYRTEQPIKDEEDALFRSEVVNT